LIVAAPFITRSSPFFEFKATGLLPARLVERGFQFAALLVPARLFFLKAVF
jgi:hypothetical protein